MDDLYITAVVGERLRAVRVALKYNAKEVSLEIGKSKNYVSLIETGYSKDPGIYPIAKICGVYDIPIDSLMYYTDEEFAELVEDISELDI